MNRTGYNLISAPSCTGNFPSARGTNRLLPPTKQVKEVCPMKTYLLSLVLCLGLLTACGGPAAGTSAPPEEDGAAVSQSPADSAAPSLAEDEPPVYLTCRIVDGAEDGILLLAELDAPLPGGHDDRHDGKGVYRLTVTEDTPVCLDGQPASAGDLTDGMPLEIAFNGVVLETFPAQLGEVYSVSGYSIGTAQCPGGSYYDLCGLYLQALDDLWKKDPALNEDVSLVSLDLSQTPGGLLESEKSALAWRFGELHGAETLGLTFEELQSQGYLTASPLSTPAPEEGEDFSSLWYSWEDGCLFSIRANGSHGAECYALPVLFFDAEKWRTPLGAYCLYDCSALWPECGTWSGYTVGSEMIS